MRATLCTLAASVSCLIFAHGVSSAKTKAVSSPSLTYEDVCDSPGWRDLISSAGGGPDRIERARAHVLETIGKPTKSANRDDGGFEFLYRTRKHSGGIGDTILIVVPKAAPEGAPELGMMDTSCSGDQ